MKYLVDPLRPLGGPDVDVHIDVHADVHTPGQNVVTPCDDCLKR
jgi:hypothetical protein